MKFIRFGGLSSIKCKTFSTNNVTFYSPPVRKGLYAFVYPYIEYYLLSGETSNINSKYSKFEHVKDADGNNVKLYSDDYTMNEPSAYVKKHYSKYIKNDDVRNFYINTNSVWFTNVTDKSGNIINEYLIKLKKPVIFTYTGNIWHHLGVHCKPFEIIHKKHSWVLTDINSFEIAFNKELHYQARALHHAYNSISNISSHNNRQLDKDVLEVFIEKV